jgi:hypothetical protein
VDGLLPLRLQLGERLLAQVAGLAPAVAELVQDAVERPSSRRRAAVRLSPAQALTSAISARRWARCSADSALTLSSQACTTL